MNDKQTVKIFYSYSHRDEELRNELEAHLSILKRQGLIEEWHDRKILPGKTWDKEIDNNIDDSEIILLLVSTDFIASDYCYGIELKRALDRHEANQAIVIPIIIRPTDWTEESFAKIQALPEDAVPVTTWSNRDEAWLDVAKGIRKAVENIKHLRARNGQEFGLMSVNELLKDNIRRLEKAYEKNSACSGTSTGFLEFDRYIDGLHNADFIVFAARPEMGKTDILVNLALNLGAVGNSPVAFFSMKLPADNITKKLVCAKGRVNYMNYSRGWLKEDDWPKLMMSAGCIHDSKIYIDDSPNLSISDIRSKLIKFLVKNKNGFVFIDSIQHLLETGKSTDDDISELSRSIKSLAKELNITIIATASVSRKLESRIDKRPNLNDLEKWNCLNDDADVIAFMYFDQYYHCYTDNPGVVEIILGKNRKGPINTIKLKYRPECSNFEDILENDNKSGEPLDTDT